MYQKFAKIKKQVACHCNRLPTRYRYSSTASNEISANSLSVMPSNFLNTCLESSSISLSFMCGIFKTSHSLSKADANFTITSLAYKIFRSHICLNAVTHPFHFIIMTANKKAVHLTSLIFLRPQSNLFYFFLV